MTAWAIIFAASIWVYFQTRVDGWIWFGYIAFVIVVAYTVGDLLSFL